MMRLINEKTKLNLDDPYFKDLYNIEDGIPVFKYFVNGEWKSSYDKAKIVSPIDNNTIAYISRPSETEVENAIDNIYKVGRWKIRDMPGDQRLKIIERMADLIEKHQDAIIDSLIINAGKTYNSAKGEVSATIERLKKAPLDLREIIGDLIPGDWSSEALETEALIRREPYGISLIIIPFNYPLFDSANKITYTMLPGNALILKPPSSDPIPSLFLVKAALDAGFPKESIALITIPGRSMSKVVSNSKISIINLTGSTKTGIEVMKEAGIKQFIMELGGGDPAIVLSDADINLASERISLAITSYSGQRCDSIKLILAENKIYDELKNKLLNELSKVKVGDPRDKSVSMGPLIDKSSADEWEEAVKDAEKKGCKIIFGGKRINETFITPALIECDQDKVKDLIAYKEEIFSSIAIITKFDDLNQAIELANGRRYGLDASIFGNDVNTIRKLIRLLEVGAIYINDMPKHGINYYPFGGRKDSGIGREGIGYSIGQVTAMKSIVYNYKGKRVWEYI
ncbi:NAD-dependent aldehyde dehydrogenase [Caldisphaera lagunensis DSM 15908]|uniref:NAD-dependent aldehyde dehydrogenase n=2 Tax=Caldisphaera lagunensis TaxID=200415 RepID=L0AAN5_CALLD|nr:NAD-dependent aldehyde dehydrogenase [Caldisphaera lagunensis DSM 15908]